MGCIGVVVELAHYVVISVVIARKVHKGFRGYQCVGLSVDTALLVDGIIAVGSPIDAVGGDVLARHLGEEVQRVLIGLVRGVAHFSTYFGVLMGAVKALACGLVLSGFEIFREHKVIGFINSKASHSVPLLL